ncbi:MAG TPA: hypothetical protein VGW35_18875 [Methylomirabilota bacterium]|jgi:hypothetical protein|nr:hypothetical protein [Methylomirabilota bacterium]
MIDREPGTVLRFTARLWAVALGVALVLVTLPEIHVHAEGTPALYDEDCPLAKLDLGPGNALLPDVVEPPHPLLAGDPALPSPGRSVPATPRPSFDPRAPPPAA